MLKTEELKKIIRAYLSIVWLDMFASIVGENDPTIKDWYYVNLTTKTTQNTCKVLLNVYTGVVQVDGTANFECLECIYGLEKLLNDFCSEAKLEKTKKQAQRIRQAFEDGKQSDLLALFDNVEVKDQAEGSKYDH